MEMIVLIARIVLAVIFALASITKLLDRPGTRQTLRDFSVPAWLTSPLGMLLPLAELAVAVLVVPVGSAWLGALGALGLLVLFCTGISLNLARGHAPECHCFGQLHSEPVSWTTLARNVGLSAIAGLVLWQGWDGGGLSVVAWVGALSTPERIGVAMCTAGLGLFAIQSWFVLHLLRQNGRFLTRLEQLEARLMPGIQRPPVMPVQPVAGLPLGVPAPTFRLPDLRGNILTLEALRAPGKPALLLFSDPDCGPCKALMPDIGRWHREHSAQMTLAVISRGAREANRAKSVEHDINITLLQRDREVAEAYHSYGTPSAVLVTSEGIIGSALASGADAIHALVARTIGMPAPGQKPAELPLPLLPPHRHHGNGAARRPANLTPVKIGDPAPALTLPDLTGRSVNLADLRGSSTLVLFWNPACGFCQRMLTDLKAWEDQPPQGAPTLLVVSTGAVVANQSLRLRSPIVLDPHFHASRAFGAHGTPMAVLIDAQGRVASEVAAGASAVLALAGCERACALT